MKIEIIDGENRPIIIFLDKSMFDYTIKAFQEKESFFINDGISGQYIQIGADLINRSFIRIVK